METKLFELRDRVTMIPIMATRLEAANEQEAWILGNSGFGVGRQSHMKYIMMGELIGGGRVWTSDPFKQPIEELRQAHMYILEHFDDLEHGAVIDLEYIRGERDTPSKSDRFYVWGE
jgi:hypothetical protein